MRCKLFAFLFWLRFDTSGHVQSGEEVRSAFLEQGESFASELANAINAAKFELIEAFLKVGGNDLRIDAVVLLDGLRDLRAKLTQKEVHIFHKHFVESLTNVLIRGTFVDF